MGLSGINSCYVSWIFPDVYSEPTKFENYGFTKTLKVSFSKCRLWVFLDCTYYKEHVISSAWLFPRECFWVLRERLEIKENP